MSPERDRSEEPDPTESREAVPADQQEVESSADIIDSLKGHHRGFDDVAGIAPGQRQGTEKRPSPDRGDE